MIFAAFNHVLLSEFTHYVGLGNIIFQTKICIAYIRSYLSSFQPSMTSRFAHIYAIIHETSVFSNFKHL